MNQTDQKDLEEFVRKNYPDVYRYLYHRVSSTADAQDLTQETFLRYVRSAEGESDREAKGRAYLFTIARNLSIDHIRSRKPDAVPLTPELEDTVAAPECVNDHFAEAIDTLPEDMKEVLSLRYSQEMQVSEIARITGSSRFAVSRKIKRALSLVEKSWEGTKP